MKMFFRVLSKTGYLIVALRTVRKRLATYIFLLRQKKNYSVRNVLFAGKYIENMTDNKNDRVQPRQCPRARRSPIVGSFRTIPLSPAQPRPSRFRSVAALDFVRYVGEDAVRKAKM